LKNGYGEEVLIERYIGFVREIGHLPVKGELRIKRRGDPSFPNDKVFERFGIKSQLIAKVLDYCRNHDGFDDVVQLCNEFSSGDEPIPHQKPNAVGIGCVYLLKSGRRYKIGRTNAIGRREYELGTKLPDESRTVHVIPTDDPAGIESYWHNRFAAKRTRGEWFELDSSDVQAFKRWKHM